MPRQNVSGRAGKPSVAAPLNVALLPTRASDDDVIVPGTVDVCLAKKSRLLLQCRDARWRTGQRGRPVEREVRYRGAGSKDVRGSRDAVVAESGCRGAILKKDGVRASGKASQVELGAVASLVT